MEDELLLPIAQSVAAQTIANDIVAVELLAAPNMELEYINYIFDIIESISKDYSVDTFFNDDSFEDYYVYKIKNNYEEY